MLVDLKVFIQLIQYFTHVLLKVFLATTVSFVILTQLVLKIMYKIFHKSGSGHIINLKFTIFAQSCMIADKINTCQDIEMQFLAKCCIVSMILFDTLFSIMESIFFLFLFKKEQRLSTFEKSRGKTQFSPGLKD